PSRLGCRSFRRRCYVDSVDRVFPVRDDHVLFEHQQPAACRGWAKAPDAPSTDSPLCSASVKAAQTTDPSVAARDTEVRAEAASRTHLEVSGLRVRCLSEGAGEPVLVLHGWGGSIESVRPIVAALTDVANAYAVDLPGFGESDPPPEAWGTGEYAAF